MKQFTFFYGHNRERLGDTAVFSQWYKNPFFCEGRMFPTAEHWMMYNKARLFDDDAAAIEILDSDFPGEVKDIGRRVKNFDPVIWDEEKLGIVRIGNILKFSQSEELERILLATSDTILVEASPYDDIWGIGVKSNHKSATHPAEWRGQNLLGFVLMDVRAILGDETHIPDLTSDVTSDLTLDLSDDIPY